MHGKTAALLVFAACTNDVLQGKEYTPPNDLPLGTPTNRSDLEGGVLDAQVVVPPLQLTDASVAPSNSCMSARDIGSVSGDTSGPPLTASGTCSEWVKFRATEDDSSATGVTMKVTLTLSGDGFRMFAFFDAVEDQVSCQDPKTSPLTWGEGNVPNGSDDSRTITVAIIKDAPCNADAWSLSITGH